MSGSNISDSEIEFVVNRLMPRHRCLDRSSVIGEVIVFLTASSSILVELSLTIVSASDKVDDSRLLGLESKECEQNSTNYSDSLLIE